MTRAVWRFRLAAAAMVLVALAFLQSPGLVAADTKLDLTANPAGFLSRALHLWDPTGFFGQLQNQAYGYLVPMGPFFLAGKLLALPAWVVQRLWWSTVLVVAFLGVVRLARLLGIDAPWARFAAGLAYALSPRVVTTLGPLSAETWVLALMPWTLVPLAARGAPRVAAARSAAVVVLMGAVNAVATAATLPAAAWYLLTREPGPARRRLAAWWVGAVMLACLWWAVPLLLLGRYSPPFLDWIEAAAVTTIATDTGAALRGTSDWVAYVGGVAGPSWPAGWALVTEPLLLAATGLVALLGLVGLALRPTRERAFLVGLLVLGLLAVTFGHVYGAASTASPAWAPGGRDLLDGALAPLRNLHKFDPLLRLPVALGFGWSVVALGRVERRQRPALGRVERRQRPALGRRVLSHRVLRPVGVALAAAVLLGVAAWPAVGGRLTAGRTYAELPGYWRDTAHWLAREPGRALVVPGASFGVYLWGRSQDEPLQPLAGAPWAVRDAVPLSSAGNIRALDAVEQVLSDGRGSPGLAPYLARMGVTHLVVRNDLDRTGTDVPRASLVHQALERSGGFARVRTFGPAVSPFRTEDVTYDDGLEDTYPAVEVYAVSGAPPDPTVVLRDAREPTVVVGGAEALLPLASEGSLGDGTAVMSGDQVPELPAGRVVQTDGMRRVEVDFGRVQDHASGTLAADDPWRVPRRVHDYLPSPPPDPAPGEWADRTRAVASSSGSDVGGLRAPVPGQSPHAALDGDGTTAWRSAVLGTPVGQWWQLVYPEARRLGPVTVRLAAGPGAVQATRLQVTTTDGSVEVGVGPDGTAQLAGSPEPTTFLRLTLVATAGELPGQQFAIAEVTGAGKAGYPVRAPGGPADAVSLAARGGSRGSCVALRTTYACSERLTRAGEDDAGLDRLVDLRPGTWDVRLQLRARPGPALDALLDPVRSVRVAASSTAVADPLARPQAAADVDARTTWRADPLDRDPVLDLTLPAPAEVSWLQLVVAADANVSRPFGVTVSAGGRSYPLFTDERGRLSFPRTLTDRIRLTLTSSRPVTTVEPATGARSVLPVGVSEVVLGEADRFRGGLLPAAVVAVPCGQGPRLDLGDTLEDTTVSATVEQLLHQDVLTARACRVAPSVGGPVRLTARSTALFTVVGAALSRGTAAAAAAPTSPEVLRAEPTRRELRVAPAPYPRTLELTENASAGWVAELDGVRLAPVRVDGWRQGWVVPAGAGGLAVLSFAPDGSYRAGLVVGLGALLVLLALLLVPARASGERVRPRAYRYRPVLVVALTLVAGYGVGGVAGLVGAALAVIALAARPAATRAGAVRLLLVAGAATAALLPAVLTPWPATAAGLGPAAAYAMSAGAGVLVAALAFRPPSQRPEPPG